MMHGYIYVSKSLLFFTCHAMPLEREKQDEEKNFPLSHFGSHPSKYSHITAYFYRKITFSYFFLLPAVQKKDSNTCIHIMHIPKFKCANVSKPIAPSV